MEIEILIDNNGTIYSPAVRDGVSVTWNIHSSPGKISFSVIKDPVINFSEGNSVLMKLNGLNFFLGRIFKKERDKSGLINVLAYDQLRYLKNKDTFIFSDITASNLIRKIAGDFKLNCGIIDDTKLVFPSRVEENKTLLDMIQSALDDTLAETGTRFVLFDDCGNLTLRNADSMKLDILVDASSAENFSYASSVDDLTFNRIKLIYENGRTGKREVFIAQNADSIALWGPLQLFESLKEPYGASALADSLLARHNNKTRTLAIYNLFGDARVRAGSSVAVSLNLGDIAANSFMLADSVTHSFKNSTHSMNLTLIGGDFIA